MLEEVPIGERFVVTVVQYPLSDSEGPYLVALAIGDPAVTVWETTLEVPAEFQVVEASWGAARTYAAGEPVYFHISNHGENTWSFVSLVHQADD